MKSLVKRSTMVVNDNPKKVYTVAKKTFVDGHGMHIDENAIPLTDPIKPF